MLLVLTPTFSGQVIKGLQQRMPVRPHARVVPVGDALDIRQRLQQRERLVNLLLILREDETGL